MAAEGYSAKGQQIQSEIAELSELSELLGIEETEISSAISQKKATKANVSYSTAVARGFSTAAGGAYATQESARLAYAVSINADVNTVSYEAAQAAGFNAADENTKVFATQEDAIKFTASQLDKEIAALGDEYNSVYQKHIKTSQNAKKKEAELKQHHTENIKDKNIYERLITGDKIRGREKD